MYLNILSYRNNEKIWWRIANCGDCFHVVTLHDCSVIFIIKIPMLWWICIFWTIGGVLPVEACSFDVKVILYVKLDRFALLVPVSVLVSLTVCGVCKRMQHLYGFDLPRLLVRMARIRPCVHFLCLTILYISHMPFYCCQCYSLCCSLSFQQANSCQPVCLGYTQLCFRCYVVSALLSLLSLSSLCQIHLLYDERYYKARFGTQIKQSHFSWCDVFNGWSSL